MLSQVLMNDNRSWWGHILERKCICRLPCVVCWSQSCPLTCPTTSAALRSDFFQPVRGHVQSNQSVNKLDCQGPGNSPFLPRSSIWSCHSKERTEQQSLLISVAVGSPQLCQTMSPETVFAVIWQNIKLNVNSVGGSNWCLLSGPFPSLCLHLLLFWLNSLNK